MFPPKIARHALPSPPAAPGAPCWLVSHRSCHGPQLYSQTICPKAPRPAAEHGPRGSPPSRSCSSEAPNRVLGRCPGETQGWQPQECVCSPAKRVPPTVPRILPLPRKLRHSAHTKSKKGLVWDCRNHFTSLTFTLATCRRVTLTVPQHRQSPRLHLSPALSGCHKPAQNSCQAKALPCSGGSLGLDLSQPEHCSAASTAGMQLCQEKSALDHHLPAKGKRYSSASCVHCHRGEPASGSCT